MFAKFETAKKRQNVKPTKSYFLVQQVHLPENNSEDV